MSDFTDVNLVGPDGENGIFRIFPEFCEVLYERKLAKGDGGLVDLLAALKEHSTWDGSDVVVVARWFSDRVLVRIKLPEGQQVSLYGSRKSLGEALTSVLISNI